MNVKNLFKNLLTKAEQDSTTKASLAEQNAKDYAVTVRRLDYANAISPISTNQTTQWTYTAPSDGVLMVNFNASARAYTSSSINGEGYAHITPTFVSGQVMVSEYQVMLSRGDVFVLAGLSANCFAMTNTKFVPYIVGGGN